MAFYFIDYEDSATHDARNVLGTLTKRITSQDEQCYEIAETLYQKYYQDGEMMRPYIIEDIKQCLVDMMKTLDHGYILVDALDEYITDRSSILELLHIAVRESNWAVLGELSNRGLDADCLDDLSRTPLVEVCVANDPEAIRLLYEKGARKVANKDTYALLAAFEEGCMDVISALSGMPELRIDWRATFRYRLKIPSRTPAIDDATYFHVAAYHGL